MPHSFFLLLRFAGTNVSFVLVVVAFLAWVVIVAWRVLLGFCAAILIVLIGVYAGVAKHLGVQSKLLTEEQRLAAKSLSVSLASALRVCNGGRYGGQRRMMRAIKAKRRNS